MKLTTDPRVAAVFEGYPPNVVGPMKQLREMVLEVAWEVDGLDQLEETLKWGEPSYLTKHGSTLRMDWKSKKPDSYAIYFKCTSKLVPTFKTLFKDTFTFEDNRAIVFKLDEKIPEEALKQCIKMTLTYHKRKHLPLLGRHNELKS